MGLIANERTKQARGYCLQCITGVGVGHPLDRKVEQIRVNTRHVIQELLYL